MSGALTHSPADVMRRLLISLGGGTAPAIESNWPLFTGNEPPTPDNCLTTYDTQGRQDGRSQASGEQFEHHGFQIRVRASSHDVGFAKARSLAVLLDETVIANQVSIGTSVYLVYSAHRTSGVIPLGTEPGTERQLFTVNAVVTLRQVT